MGSMPRVARFTIAALDELLRQLRYAPRATRIRQMNAAERLLRDVDPARTYPQEFITYRITGYRPDTAGAPVGLAGEALLGDLATMVLRLSDGLDLPADFEGRRAIPVEDVAGQLRVSEKTLQRYRRRGLVCHAVMLPDGSRRLVCFDDALRWFVDRHRDRIERAGSFSRIESGAEDRIIKEARRLRQRHGLSLNETAHRLSRKYDRAHETLRGLLRRHDAGAEHPIFTEHGPLTERDARFIHRAWRWGVSPADLARRFGKSPATIHRVLHRRQAVLLRRVDLTFIVLPTFALDEAESVILSSPAVTSGLDALLPEGDTLRLIEAAHAQGTAEEDVIHALAGGYNLLKRRARQAIEALPTWPASAALDRIETDLRWATRLKRRLVSAGIPDALAAITQNLHRPLRNEPADRIVALLRLAAEVVSRLVESFDPSQGQRFDRLCRYATDRALAASAAASGTAIGRAAARHEPGTVGLEPVLAGVTSWEGLLELRPDLRVLVPSLDRHAARAVHDYYGLGSAPPVSRRELAERLGRSPTATSRLLRRAELALLTLARAASE